MAISPRAWASGGKGPERGTVLPATTFTVRGSTSGDEAIGQGKRSAQEQAGGGPAQKRLQLGEPDRTHMVFPLPATVI